MFNYKDKRIDVMDVLCDFAQVINDATREEMADQNSDYIEKVALLKENHELYRKVVEECPEDRKRLIQGYMVDLMDKVMKATTSI